MSVQTHSPEEGGERHEAPVDWGNFNGIVLTGTVGVSHDVCSPPFVRGRE